MRAKDHLFTSAAGVRWGLQADAHGLGGTIYSESNLAPIQEANNAMASHNDGYTPDKSWRRCASIPLQLIEYWKITEGWDALSPDPDCQKKLAQKLDDPQWRDLRTAEFTVGDHWKHSI